MKTHSTNYFNAFIEVAEDTKADKGIAPPAKTNKTVAERQFEMIVAHPYNFTSDDVFFQVYADRNELTKAEYADARATFFSKGQPCFRASPLTKTYGFGVHSNAEGKIALMGVETPEYQKCLVDDEIKKVKAMKSSR